jgi:predicted Fe-S protein YdhL (DUF1289 family)
MLAIAMSPSASSPPASSGTRSLFAAGLQRCTARGIRFFITAPSDLRAFSHSINRFPERVVDPCSHAQWETDYRVFCGRGRERHERGSWLILAVGADDRVLGAITARFFRSELIAEYLHALTLLHGTGPVLREYAEKAIADAFVGAIRAGRTPGEISHWSVDPGPDAALIGATLVRAMSALAAAFDSPLVIIAADHRRGEVARLMRHGSAPLGCAGRFSLPPFVNHVTGAWLRLLLVDVPTFQLRSRCEPAADLALLRQRVPIISLG